MKTTLTLLFLSLFALNLNAQVYVDGSASGAGDGSSWTNAYADLSDALANHTSGEIWIAAGTYTPGGGIPDTAATFLVQGPLSIYGGFDGSETQLDQRDFEANKTILSGDILGDDVVDDFDNNKSDNAYHIMVIDSLLTENVIIDGLNFSGGYTSEFADQFFSRGGAIHSFSTMEVDNCNFFQNWGDSGGCIFISPWGGGSDGSKITNSSFTNNYGFNRAAAIYMFDTDNVTISNCEFKDNQTNRGAVYPNECDNVQLLECVFDNNEHISSTGFGGALFSWQSTNFLIKKCEFKNNEAGNGGVIYTDGRDIEPDSTNTVFDECTFSNNFATDFGAAAIYSWRNSFTVKNCDFDRHNGPSAGTIYLGGDLFIDNEQVVFEGSTFKNSSAGFAGAIANYGANASFKDCQFQNNSADSGGGCVSTGFVANSSFDNCQFLLNSAGWGGALFTQNDSSTVTISNSTFSFNEYNSSGGGILSSGGNTLTIDGSTFESNSGGDVGGAISITKEDSIVTPSILTATNCIMKGNLVNEQGGAIYFNNTNGKLINCALINNINLGPGAGTGGGGAISLNVGEQVAVELSVINSTIAGNSSVLGAGISGFTSDVSSRATLNLQNTILDNVGSNYELEAGTPEVISLGGNLSTDLSLSDVLVGTNDKNEIADFKFIDLLNGSAALDGDSPAIDNGVDGPDVPSQDILGNDRLDLTDSGAYEYIGTIGLDDLEIQEDGLELFPNPALDFIKINLENQWRGTVKSFIYDAQGKLVYSFSLDKYAEMLSQEIELAGLMPSSYLMVLTHDNQAVVQSFVKL